MKLSQTTDKELAILEFRKDKFKEKMQELESILSGNQMQLKHFTEQDGVYSEEKTWELVNQLQMCLERYYEKEFRADAEEGEELDAPEELLSEQEKQFYQSLLYCTIRVSILNPWWNFTTTGTFEDILRLAKDIETNLFYEKEELFAREIYLEETIDGVIGCMDDIYRRITGDSITTTISKTDYVNAKNNPHILEAVGEMDPEQAEMMEQYDSVYYAEHCLEDEEFQQGREEYEYELKREERITKEIEELPYKKELCEQYLRYREVYFNMGIQRDVVRNLEAMLDIFFYIQEKSLFNDDEEFFTAYTLLNKIVGRAKQGGKESK